MVALLKPNPEHAPGPCHQGKKDCPKGGKGASPEVVSGVYAGYVGKADCYRAHCRRPQDAVKGENDYVRPGLFHVLTVTEVGL